MKKQAALNFATRFESVSLTRSKWWSATKPLLNFVLWHSGFKPHEAKRTKTRQIRALPIIPTLAEMPCAAAPMDTSIRVTFSVFIGNSMATTNTTGRKYHIYPIIKHISFPRPKNLPKHYTTSPAVTAVCRRGRQLSFSIVAYVGSNDQLVSPMTLYSRHDGMLLLYQS